MAKAYWALAAYAKLAAPAIQASGGRFLVRGVPTKTEDLRGGRSRARHPHRGGGLKPSRGLVVPSGESKEDSRRPR